MAKNTTVIGTGTETIAVPEIDKGEIDTLDKIGGGCFGTVYKGKCRSKLVAVKKLHQQDMEDTTMDEFKKEIAILTHLRHPNIILFMGACTEKGHLAIITEFMPIGDVHSVIHNPAYTLTTMKILLMAKDVASGMNWLHLSKPPIIHRDLKPTNLLVDDNWCVKICDFGLSAFQHTKTLRDNGVAPGTPLWMSPEVLQGQSLDEKSDIYSYGIVLWEMLTKKEPFEEHDSYKVFVEAICENNERPPIPPEMHPSLQNLLEECWHANPKRRPSFKDILERLDLAIIDTTLNNDEDASNMWKKNWLGEVQVSWLKFSTVFYKQINEPLARDRERNINYQCLQKILCEAQNGESQVVTLERFGNFVKWFGPLKQGKILDKIRTLMQAPWFHGDIQRTDAETLLSAFGKGTYLVRLSFNEPIAKTPFTISKVSKSGAINHQRITARKNGSYYISLKTKKGNKKIEATGSLELLLKKGKKELSLDKVCPGWKYRDLFTTNKIDGYLPQDDDSDDE